MKIARYWEKASTEGTGPNGHALQATGWGWSATGADQARQRASETAQRVLAFLIDGNFDQIPHEYGYDQRPPREEIIDEFTDSNDQTNAIVTRNSYGCLILNTRDLVFIDVDFPPRRPSIAMPRILRRLLGRREPPNVETRVLDNIRQAAGRQSQFGFRVYRTRNGYRVMVHTEAIASQSPRAETLLNEFDADPLYRRLCKYQECYRARLTPKAWRCQLPNPPHRFPFQSETEKDEYERWDARYRQDSDKFCTCRYLETIGSAECSDELQGLIELHDGLTKAMSEGPLA